MQAAYVAWLARGANDRKQLPVVFAILAGGGPVQLERLLVRGGDLGAPPSSMYLETSSFGRRALALCLEAHGPAQVLYGSDSPVGDPRPTLRALDELGDAVSDAVRVENPTRLFG
jgi:predicted TIM-barrel fold metal-dependent hydrolase